MKPTLFVLAAGMGSRYGGLKQLDGLGPHGETIMDYSIYDAVRSGFGKVVFVIRKDFEADFREKILSKYKDHIQVEIVFQGVDSLPEGYICPADRQKPWGTNHAVLMGKAVIKEPFAVINADDFYGRNTFEVMAEELMRERETTGDYCMVGFEVGNTMSEGGTVSRGVCDIKKGYLTNIVERTSIGYNSKGAIVYPDENGTIQKLKPTTLVSMNMWGFTPDYFDFSETMFSEFLDENLNNPKAEYFIPSVVNQLIVSGDATVKVMRTNSKWFGVTYPTDRPFVIEKLAELHAVGEYPEKLFE
ncbi:MAG: nucleotidyltransferase [Muribaculaceae bacterium]|nr:nucleotidyltransferase [Muribaculaceae bacterium]